MSTVDFEKLKRVEKEQKDLVWGCIHCAYNFAFFAEDIPPLFQIIPALIYHICLSYYCAGGWDTNLKGDDIILTDDIITMNESTIGYGYSSIFLNVILHQSGRHSFKFKILTSMGWDKGIQIGVMERKINASDPSQSYLNSNFMANSKDDIFGKYHEYITFGWAATDAKLVGTALIKEFPGDILYREWIYGSECDEGDVVEMIIDFGKMEISYKLNGIDFGIAFNMKRVKYSLRKVHSDSTLQPFVVLQYSGDSVQLL